MTLLRVILLPFMGADENPPQWKLALIFVGVVIYVSVLAYFYSFLT